MDSAIDAPLPTKQGKNEETVAKYFWVFCTILFLITLVRWSRSQRQQLSQQSSKLDEPAQTTIRGARAVIFK